MSVVSDVIKSGTHAGRPSASTSNDGYLYYETDTQILFRSNGSAWVQVAAGAAVAGYTDEQAQDAIGAMADSNTLIYTDATPLLEVKKQMSITADGSGLKLSGDSSSPGNNKVYGTDGSGVKGWKADPAGGGASLSYFGITGMSAVPSSSWTWDNQSTSTITSSGGVEAMAAVSSGSEWRLRYRTPANSHWSIKVLIAGAGAGSGSVFGIGFRDSGGKMFMLSYYLTATMYTMHWTSSTSFSGTVTTDTVTPVITPIWMKAEYDGTNIALYYSIDSVVWILLKTETLTTFLASGTPNFCWGADCIGGAMKVSLLSYEETALP
jgi:hypothetical protein